MKTLVLWAFLVTSASAACVNHGFTIQLGCSDPNLLGAKVCPGAVGNCVARITNHSCALARLDSLFFQVFHQNQPVWTSSEVVQDATIIQNGCYLDVPYPVWTLATDQTTVPVVGYVKVSQLIGNIWYGNQETYGGSVDLLPSCPCP